MIGTLVFNRLKPEIKTQDERVECIQTEQKSLHSVDDVILVSFLFIDLVSGDINLFKMNNGNTRQMCEICSKLTIKTLERRQ